MSKKKTAAYTPAGAGSLVNADLVHMSQADRKALEQTGEDWTRANEAGSEQAKAEAHRRAETIRGRYGYSGGGDGSELIRRGPDFAGMLDRWLENAKQQQENAADYAVQQGTARLEQAREEGEKRLRERQDQVEREERKALDNHALYMEARGDRGGIGHAQYGSIQARAMKDRQEVSRARMALATETARKIADLRAQGEFKKADALLDLTQEYLGKMTSLYQWQEEHQLDEDKLQAQLGQWDREFELKVGETMGAYRDQPTLEARKGRQDLEIRLGLAALEQGVRPSPSQLKALGWSDSQVDRMLQHYREKLYRSSGGKKSSGGSRGSGGSKGGGTSDEENEYAQIQAGMPPELKELDVYQQLYALGCRSKGDAFYHLVHRSGVSDSTARSLAAYFQDKLAKGDLQDWWDGYSAIPKEPVGNVSGGLGVDRWIYIPGAGRVGVKELPAMLEKGYVAKRVDAKTGKVYYSARR